MTHFSLHKQISEFIFFSDAKLIVELVALDLNESHCRLDWSPDCLDEIPHTSDSVSPQNPQQTQSINFYMAR